MSLKDTLSAYKKATAKTGETRPAGIVKLESDVALAEADLGLLNARRAAPEEIERAQARVANLKVALATKKAELGL